MLDTAWNMSRRISAVSELLKIAYIHLKTVDMIALHCFRAKPNTSNVIKTVVRGFAFNVSVPYPVISGERISELPSNQNITGSQ